MTATKYRTLRAACEWSKGGASLSMRNEYGLQLCCKHKVLAEFLIFGLALCVGSKTVTKPQPAATQQASLTIATVGFLVFAGGTEAITKNTKELQ